MTNRTPRLTPADLLTRRDLLGIDLDVDRGGHRLLYGTLEAAVQGPTPETVRVQVRVPAGYTVTADVHRANLVLTD